MSKLKKRVYGKMITAENCAVAGNSCNCFHTYCECGSSPRDYIDAHTQHYWSDESNMANY